MLLWYWLKERSGQIVAWLLMLLLGSAFCIFAVSNAIAEISWAVSPAAGSLMDNGEVDFEFMSGAPLKGQPSLGENSQVLDSDRANGISPTLDRARWNFTMGAGGGSDAIPRNGRFALLAEIRQNELAAGEVPERLEIPAINLDAPIVPVGAVKVLINNKLYQTWEAPDYFAAGWHSSSARLGVPGNTVLNGHHNINGEVFKYLIDLQIGDIIIVHGAERSYSYVVANKLILPEKGQPLNVRLGNTAWLQASSDERLTLVTCWPYNNNTHRLIIAARPKADQDRIDSVLDEDISVKPLVVPTQMQ